MKPKKRVTKRHGIAKVTKIEASAGRSGVRGTSGGVGRHVQAVKKPVTLRLDADAGLVPAGGRATRLGSIVSAEGDGRREKEGAGVRL